jgi:hypothetical protein
MMRYLKLALILIIGIILLTLIWFKFSLVLWKSSDDSSIQLVSHRDLNNFYREINKKYFGVVFINYKNQPRLLKNNLPSSDEIVAYNRDRP